MSVIKSREGTVLYHDFREISLDDYHYSSAIYVDDFNSFKESVRSSDFFKSLKGVSLSLEGLFVVLKEIGSITHFSSELRPEYNAWLELCKNKSIDFMLSDEYDNLMKSRKYVTDPQAVFDFNDLILNGGMCRQLAVSTAAVLYSLGFECSYLSGKVNNLLVDGVPFIKKSFNSINEGGEHLWLKVRLDDNYYSVDPTVFTNTLHDELEYSKSKTDWLRYNAIIKI